MLVLITYDVNTSSAAGRRRLRRVARICVNFGQRVQYSVFECVLDSARWVEVSNKLAKEIDPEVDSLRYYFLGDKWQRRVEHVGAKASYDPEGSLIV